MKEYSMDKITTAERTLEFLSRLYTSDELNRIQRVRDIIEYQIKEGCYRRAEYTLLDITIIALLQNVISDSKMSYSEVTALFGETVANGVLRMSKPSFGSYPGYIKELAYFKILCYIKIADILVSLTENPGPMELQKYAAALSILTIP